MKDVHLSVPEPIIRRLDQYAREHELSRSEVARRAFLGYLAAMQRREDNLAAAEDRTWD